MRLPFRVTLATLFLAAALPVAQPVAAVGSTSGGCSAAQRDLTTAQKTATAVYRAEMTAARKEFRRSDRTAADRRELAAHRTDARQARRALVARAEVAVERKC